jgi:hypothetical protein
MWNPFRRRKAANRFQKPKWPPIQNLDSLDIIGHRKDGGVDLVIVASQPIDDSPETLESLRHKVRTYVTAIGLEGFQTEFAYPPREKIAIIIACEHPIHPNAQLVIDECKAFAAGQTVSLEVRDLLHEKL